MKNFLPVVLLIASASAASLAQNGDRTIYVKHFPGSDLGAKVTGAQGACNSDASASHCVLVLDPSLAALPPGVMPPLCARCTLLDNRNGSSPIPAPAAGRMAAGDRAMAAARPPGVQEPGAAVPTGDDFIASSIRDCASRDEPCVVRVPQSASAKELQPFGATAERFGAVPLLGPKSSEPSAAVEDMRSGVPQWVVNQSQTSGPHAFSIPAFSMNSTSGPAGVNGMLPYTLELTNNAYSGGRNSYNMAGGYGDKVNVASLFMRSYRYTQAQGGGDQSQSVVCLGNGDCVGHAMDTVSYGGPNTMADEGNESMRYEAIEGGQVFGGTVGNITTSADLSATITTATQTFNGYQGEGRMLIDLSKALSSGTSSYVASIATGSGNLVVTCGGACNWDSVYGASAHTALTAPVGNGSSNVNTFPQPNAVLPVSSSAGFTPGKIACIFDYDYECEEISAVPDGSHVTIATMRLPHLPGAYVTTGGLAGYAFEFEADRVVPGKTNGVSTMPDSALVSTVRQAIPIMYSSQGNSLTLLYGAGLPGAYAAYTGRAYRSMGGSGGSVQVTVSGGSVTACSASGGRGYINPQNPPQLQISGVTFTSAPQVYVSAISGGALSGCAVASPGAGISGAPAVSILPSNPYDIYPSTKVTGVYNASLGKVDGSFSTEPLSGSFAPGDAVEQPHYFLQGASGSRNVVGSYLPSIASGAHAGLGYALTGIWQGNDKGLAFANMSSPALYLGYPAADPWNIGHGQLGAPYGFNLFGPFGVGFLMDTPPLGSAVSPAAVVNVRCGTLGCANWTSPYSVLKLRGYNGSSEVLDGLQYQPSTRAFTFAGATFNFPPGSINASALAGNAGSTGAPVAEGSSNSPFSASLATSAGPSDTVRINGMTPSGHCSIGPTNQLAASNVSTTYLRAKGVNQVTVAHAPAAGMTYDLVCTPY